MSLPVIGILLGVVFGLFMSSEALALRSGMTGVKFDDVELHIATLPVYQKQLTERAFQGLSKAGLTPQRKIDRHLVEEGKAYTLLITLYPHAIDGCPDHYSYATRMELLEWVYFDRVEARVPLMSWFMKDFELVPSVIAGPPSLERLEQDLDKLMADLIQHYKVVNHPANLHRQKQLSE